MQKIKQLIIIAVMFALALPAIVLASPPSLPPILISGTVTIDGNPAPVGTEISAEINNIEVSIVDIDSVGIYSITIPSENFNPESVLVYVNDNIANTVPEITNSPVQKIDLSITTEPDLTPDTTPYCGDGTCNGDETCSTCPIDCGPCNTGGTSGGTSISNPPPPTPPAVEDDEEDPLPEPEEEEILEEEEEPVVLGVATDYRAIQLNKIINEGGYVWTGNANAISSNMGVNRDPQAEVSGYNKYTALLISGIDRLEQSNIYAITNFVVYGTETTEILGAGERAGVLNSYKSAFGKLPKTESEWQDAIKIANGRWPDERSETAEAKAKQEFEKVYLREPDMGNPNDNAAVTVIAYGLRPDVRNLDSEKAGIITFKHIYGYNPVSAIDWDIVRAIAYSGAVR